MEKEFKIWRWRIFAATWLTYAGLYFARKPFSIVKANLGDAHAWDTEALGALGAFYLIAYTIGQFIAGAAGQKWGPRLVLLSGIALSIAANAACGITNSYALFAVFVTLNGLGQSTGWSNCVGTMGQWFRKDERGRVMGVWATNYQVGGMLANGLAAFALGAWGFKYSFFAGSLALLVVWVFVYFNHRNKPSDVGLEDIDEEVLEIDENGDEVAEVAWPRAVVLNIAIVGVFYFFVKFIRYAIWSWAPFLLQKNYGLDGDDAGYISTVFDAAGILGVIACGWLSDRVFNSRRALTSCVFILGMVVSCVLLYTVGSNSVWLFAVCMGMIGFTLYGPDALMTGAGAIDVGAAKRATVAAGVINGMGSVGAVVQELVLGRMLKTQSVEYVFGTLLFSALAALACLAYLLWRGARGKASV